MSKSWLATAAILTAFVGGFFLGHRNSPGTSIRVQTDTLVVRDTITLTEVVSEVVTRVTRDTVWLESLLEVPVPVEVEVPIEHKATKLEDATVYHHGFRSFIDSVDVYPKTVYITKEITRAQPAPRWSFGVAAGPSLLVTPSGNVHGGLGLTAGVCYRF